MLILDEPTNDLDTDMLAAMEDLLDSWPGTLLVVSHDRYLIERVTDQQYAILDGRLRHLPGGVEEYLKLAPVEEAAQPPCRDPDSTRRGDDAAWVSAAPTAATPRRSSPSIDRRLAKLADAIRSTHDEFAAHDQGDYVGLGALQAKLSELESEPPRSRSAGSSSATRLERWLDATATAAAATAARTNRRHPSRRSTTNSPTPSTRSRRWS